MSVQIVQAASSRSSLDTGLGHMPCSLLETLRSQIQGRLLPASGYARTPSAAMSSLAAARADNFWYPPDYDGKSSLAQVCLGTFVVQGPPFPSPFRGLPLSALLCLSTVMLLWHECMIAVCLQITGQHPLRDRARKLDQGILIIRFEMPFNCWCALPSMLWSAPQVRSTGGQAMYKISILRVRIYFTQQLPLL